MNLNSNDRFAQSIKNPSALGKGSDLIYVYPILYDGTLESVIPAIRKFISVRFINQIKLDNMTNIIAGAIDKPMPISAIPNPAEKLNKTLQGFNSATNNSSSNNQDFSNIHFDNYIAQQNSKYELQNKIDVFLRYIKTQIETDPAFKQLNPIISQFTAENLMDIPLIVGTQAKKLDKNVLYWILFISLGQSLNLRNKSNFDKIERYLKEIPTDKYLDLLYVGRPLKPHQLTPTSHKLSQLMNDIFDNTKMSLINFSIVLDEHRYAEDVGVLSDHAVVSSTAIEQMEGASMALTRKARTIFSEFVIDDALPIIQSVTHSIITDVEVDISSRFSKFSNELINKVDSSYQFMSDKIKAAVSLNDLKGMENFFKMTASLCKDLDMINVIKIIEDIRKKSFGLADQAYKLTDFISGVTIDAAKLAQRSSSLEKNLDFVSNGTVSGFYSDFKLNVRKLVQDFFEDGEKAPIFLHGTPVSPTSGPRPTGSPPATQDKFFYGNYLPERLAHSSSVRIAPSVICGNNSTPSSRHRNYNIGFTSHDSKYLLYQIDASKQNIINNRKYMTDSALPGSGGTINETNYRSNVYTELMFDASTGEAMISTDYNPGIGKDKSKPMDPEEYIFKRNRLDQSNQKVYPDMVEKVINCKWLVNENGRPELDNKGKAKFDLGKKLYITYITTPTTAPKYSLIPDSSSPDGYALNPYYNESKSIFHASTISSIIGDITAAASVPPNPLFYMNISNWNEKIPNPDYNPGESIITKISNRFNFLTSNVDASKSGNINLYLDNMYNAITEFIYFMYLYCFFSYLCEYMTEISTSIHIQKKNATEFPNYTLVVSSDILKGLYMAIAAKTFEDLYTKGVKDTAFVEFKVSQNQIKAVMTAINNRIKVPNFVVVDGKDIWYQLMFMPMPIKIDISTIEQYSNNQVNILSV